MLNILYNLLFDNFANYDFYEFHLTLMGSLNSKISMANILTFTCYL